MQNSGLFHMVRHEVNVYTSSSDLVLVVTHTHTRKHTQSVTLSGETNVHCVQSQSVREGPGERLLPKWFPTRLSDEADLGRVGGQHLLEVDTRLLSPL